MDNPSVVQFCNSELRISMNSLAKAYYQTKELLNDWSALQLSGVVPNDFTDYIIDGSETDGRPRITSGGLRLTISNLQYFIQLVETKSEGQPMSFIDGVLSIAPKYTRD